jgi:hypothetical protein
MSAGQPFVPQQPASNLSDSKTQNADTNSSTNPNLALTVKNHNKIQWSWAQISHLTSPDSSSFNPRSSHKQQNEQANRTGPGTPTLKSRGSLDGIQRPMKPAAFSKNKGFIRSRMSNNPTEKNYAQNESLSNAENSKAPPFFPGFNSTPTSGFLTTFPNTAVAFKDLLSFLAPVLVKKTRVYSFSLKAHSDLLGQ